MARTSLVPQQPVFLSEADNKQLAEMDRQREAFNAAVEKYNQGVMGPGGYNEQLNAYIARLKEIEASGEEVPLPTAPTKVDVPVAPFTEESFVQAQEAAQARAQEAAGQRALAIQAFEDPSRFNLAGFAGLGSRTFAKGGEVKEEGTKASRMMKELGLSKPPKEKTLADEPSKQTPESLAYSLRAQAEGNRDKDLRKESFSAPGALNVKRFEAGGEARSGEGFSPIAGSMGMPGAPEHERMRADTLGFIKRMDDASVMATASRMTGMPFDTPTQARLMLEQLLGGDVSVSAAVSGMGRVLPERVTGYDVGAKFPALGGQMSVGAMIPRGAGKPAFNVGYRREFQEGGEVMSPEEQPVVEESKASQALKELIRPVREGVKGYFGMDPESSGSEAYRTGQALSNMPGVGAPGAIAAGAVGLGSRVFGKATDASRRLGNPVVDTPQFKKWFGESKVVDEKGNPLVFYHGTGEDVASFKPRDGAIFLTPDPAFASKFALDDMLYTPTSEAYGNMRSGANVMPLFVKANNPFDYENPKHIRAVLNRLDPKDRRPFQAAATQGSWKEIEKHLGSIEDSGFDAVFLNEMGVKNLAVFRPEQVKSALGNEGTFDPASKVITKAEGGPVNKHDAFIKAHA